MDEEVKTEGTVEETPAMEAPEVTEEETETAEAPAEAAAE